MFRRKERTTHSICWCLIICASVLEMSFRDLRCPPPWYVYTWKCTTLSGGDNQTYLKARKPFACHARLEQFWPAKVLRHSDYRKFWFLPRPIRISDVKKVAARCRGFQCCLCFLMERSSTENFVVIKYLDTIWHVLWVYDQLPIPNLNSDLSIALLRTRP